VQATEDKNNAIAQAERTANKAALAQRLITGLAGEYTRWTESIQQMSATEGNLVGDVLLSASFVTYAGPFNAELRHELVEVGGGACWRSHGMVHEAHPAAPLAFNR